MHGKDRLTHTAGLLRPKWMASTGNPVLAVH